MRQHALDAASQVFGCVVHRDHDVDRGDRHGAHRCRASRQSRKRTHGKASHQRKLWRSLIWRSFAPTTVVEARDLALQHGVDAFALAPLIRKRPGGEVELSIALGDARRELRDLRDLPIDGGVARLEQRVEPQHFAGIGEGAPALAVLGVGEQRYAWRGGRKRPGRACRDDDEIHAVATHVRRHAVGVAHPCFGLDRRDFRPDARPGGNALVIPALCGKCGTQQAREVVAIQFVQVKLVDVVAFIAVGALVRRGDDDDAVGCKHAGELGQHPRLVGVAQMFDGFKRDDDVDRGVGQRQRSAGALDETHPRAVAVACSRVRDGGRIDVDPDRGCCRLAEQRGAVAFAAGGIEHALARDVATREGVAMPVLVGDLAGTRRQESLTRECKLGHGRGMRRAALRRRKMLDFT